MLVHLAFIILGGREETRKVNLTGSRNVFAAAARHVRRLVYTSSVAAYGFHADNPQPLTEDVRPRGSERFYYSAQKAELERALEEETAGESRPTCCARASSPGRTRSCSLRQLPPAPLPMLPDPGHAVPARPPRRRRRRARGRHARHRPARRLQPRRRRDDHARRPRPRARAGSPTRSRGSCSAPAALGARLPLCPTLAQWVNAGRVPVVMDTTKARRELGWQPRYSSRETLGELVSSQT